MTDKQKVDKAIEVLQELRANVSGLGLIIRMLKDVSESFELNYKPNEK